MSTGDGSDGAATAVSDNLQETRRCWRCLQMFPCEPRDAPAGSADEWWLCDPCHVALLGDRRR
jgi:hypothetical protein